MITTANYELQKYEGTDKPNLRDQYNNTMDLLDSILKGFADEHTQQNNLIAGLNRDVSALQTTSGENTTMLKSLNTRMGTAESNIKSVQSDTIDIKTWLDELGINSQQTAQGFKADVEDVIGEAAKNEASIQYILNQFNFIFKTDNTWTRQNIESALSAAVGSGYTFNYFVNSNETFFKPVCGLNIAFNPGTVNWMRIEELNTYGVKIGTTSIRPTDHIRYSRVVDVVTAYKNDFDAYSNNSLILLKNGDVYWETGISTSTFNAEAKVYITLSQPFLSLKNLNIEEINGF